MANRRDELKRAVGPRRSGVRTTRRQVDPRREELIRTLGVRNLKPGEKIDLLHRGKVVGPPWLGGIFQTRLNWGTLVLAFGFILFIVWLIMEKTQIGG